jgi:hypothetical protein
MDARLIGFGSVEIDGERYEKDVIIDRGQVRKRSKKLSKPYRDRYRHTPLSVFEEIPWGPTGTTLVIGTGAHGMLPIMSEVTREARRRGVDLVAVPTDQACRLVSGTADEDVRAILHVTC